MRSSADHIIRRLSAPPVATNLPEEEAATARMAAVWCMEDKAFASPLLPFLDDSLVGRRATGGGRFLGGFRGGGGRGAASFHFVRIRFLEAV